jgi:hypothetical protein
MGILRLMQLIKELCPEAIKQVDMKSCKGKIVAIDSYLVIILTKY